MQKKLWALVGWMNPYIIMKLKIIEVKMFEKKRYELLFGNCVDDYHEYDGSNSEWVNMEEFFNQVELAVELCAKYNHVLHFH